MTKRTSSEVYEGIYTKIRVMFQEYLQINDNKFKGVSSNDNRTIVLNSSQME